MNKRMNNCSLEDVSEISRYLRSQSQALKKSGFHENLEYIREEVDKHSKAKKKRRKRKIIWFNPPYSNNVKSNVEKQYLKLVR